ncbi:MAG: peptidoglycan-binding protein [Sporolactobacillus sp.]
MYPGNALAKGAAIAATFSSSFFFLPQNAAAQLIGDPSTLSKGMHGDEIRTIQSILRATGHYPLVRQTGYFGTATARALKNYQLAHGFYASGEADQATKQSLVDDAHRQLGLMSLGSNGDNVRYLQGFLLQFGYLRGQADGEFGPATRQAVITLQQVTKIHVDGIVGPETWSSIDKLAVAKKNGERLPQPAVQAAASPQNSVSHPPAKQAQPVAVRAAANEPAAEKQTNQTTTIVREFYANSTGYTARCNGCSGVTATGINLLQNPDARVVAVDPSVIPLGTKLYVEGYGYAVAADTGGAIKGQKIDLFFNNNSEALTWGRRTVKVRILSD